VARGASNSEALNVIPRQLGHADLGVTSIYRAYDASEWTDLFVAAAGASAALAGLVFVAVSINIERILALEGVPDRALQALIQLLAVVVLSLLVLAPGQSNVALGLELLAVGLPLSLVSGWLIGRALQPTGSTSPLDPRRAMAAAGTVPFVVSGVSLIVEAGGGIYWVLAGGIGALVGGVLNAWVLLVEILR
jgi:hypothetical protein